MRIAVITENKFLFQKIKLAVKERAVADMLLSADGILAYDLCLFDFDSMGGTIPSITDGTLPKTVIMGKGQELSVPFTFTELLAAIDGKGERSADLVLGDKCAYLRGERIPLTDVELALIKTLYDAGGEFVSREELLMRVWDETVDPGVINVYVYYLRQKLEHGEKIINTSRKLGYKIDKKYLGGEG